MADLAGGSMLDRIQLLAATEKGLTYIDGDGAITHVSRHSLLEDTASITSQATYGDKHAYDAARTLLRVDDVTPTRDETLIYPASRVTREGGAPQYYEDATSKGDYGNRVLDESGLLYDDDRDSFSAAAYNVARFKDERTRFEDLTISPLEDPSHWWPEILSRQFGERITIDRTPQGVGSAVIEDAYLEGRTMEFTPFTATVVLQCAPADTTLFGLWDTGAWGTALWAF